MSVFIHAIATATPRHSLSQSHALRLSRELEGASPQRARLLERIYAGTGIEHRGVVLAKRDDDDLEHFYPAGGPGDSPHGPTTAARMQAYEALAADLGRDAAAKAIDQARVRPDRVTHLVTVSCTGFSAPGLDIALLGKLGLRAAVQRTHIGFMGCHGAINGLRVARALAGESPEAVVLLCCVELCSLHYRYGAEPGEAVATALFADGAAAAVVSAAPPGGAGTTFELIDTGSVILPESQESMSWRIGDHGFQMTLAPDVPELIRRGLRPAVGEFLGRRGLRIGDVGGWAIHPGGPKVISSVADCLGLTPAMSAPSSEVLRRHGNMSSPTVLFILEELRRAETPRPWVAVAFGPGLAVEMALIG